ncbi:MAG TPA: cupredoxin domain-containing protein [Anaerolineales bacterium]|nr:cupredoxin domain-containing protein [Anaerolineales bacterium]
MIGRKALMVGVLAGALILSACGGASGPSTSIKVDFTDFKFTPDQWTVPAGQEITITVKNDGAVEHEFVIMNLGTTAGEAFGDEDEANIYWEVEAEPGESKTETFTAPSAPGEYQIVCGTEGHLEAGMIGSMTVQ